MFGIWDVAGDMDDMASIKKLHNSQERTTTLPTCIKTSVGGVIELAVISKPPPSRKTLRTYVVNIRFVDEERYTGNVGRFVPYQPRHDNRLT
jgi:hypothetical protein